MGGERVLLYGCGPLLAPGTPVTAVAWDGDLLRVTYRPEVPYVPWDGERLILTGRRLGEPRSVATRPVARLRRGVASGAGLADAVVEIVFGTVSAVLGGGGPAYAPDAHAGRPVLVAEDRGGGRHTLLLPADVRDGLWGDAPSGVERLTGGEP